MPSTKNIARRAGQMSSLVANQINAMLAYWDTRLICRFANDAYLEWFGKTKEEMIDKITLGELLGPELFEKNLPYITEALQGNKQVFEREIPMPDGKSSRHSLATYFPDVEDGKVKGFFVHVADVSYIKQLETLVSKLQLKMLREIIEAQETERAYISAQLRDNVNQTLTHCKLILQSGSGSNEHINDKTLEQGIDKAIQELNILSTNLIPSAIQDFGFIGGTESYIETNVRNLPIEFTCKTNSIEELSLPVKLSLFRIIQSFLALVIESKNENAIHIQVEYVDENITMRLRIADEAFIFYKDNKHFMDIARRVEYFGGHIEEQQSKHRSQIVIHFSQ